jgi:peptidoglycan-associated lipoprotein
MNRLIFPALMLFGCAHQAEKKDATTAARESSSSSSAAAAPATTSSSGASTASAECGPIKVHFNFNSDEIDTTDRAPLERSADCLKSNRGMRVVIEGNADERGTEEYNLALGDRRAVSVARYLESLGASKAQLKTVSYGKERPECTEHDESCWSKNRRAAIEPKSK